MADSTEAQASTDATALQHDADGTPVTINKNKRHRKEKPWDTDDIDHVRHQPAQTLLFFQS